MQGETLHALLKLKKTWFLCKYRVLYICLEGWTKQLLLYSAPNVPKMELAAEMSWLLIFERRSRMRKEITFKSQGLKCRGWLYVPDDRKPGQKVPAIVLAHGMTCLKEHCLPQVAECFVQAGFVALTFDYRFFGESEGEPRSQIFALEQVEDYRNAISWVSEQPEVDPERIGIWGTSYSGGLVLWVGTYDRRVKAVVAQNPSALNPDSRRALNPAGWDKMNESLISDRRERYRTGTVRYLPVVSAADEPCLLPGPAAYAGFMSVQSAAPNWVNQVTLESVEKIREFDPVSLVHLMSPTALLLIPAERDGIIPLAAVKDTFARAREPKALSVFPITHFQFYTEPWLSQAAGQAVQWYKKYL
jgi:uncharacterized protein